MTETNLLKFEALSYAYPTSDHPVMDSFTLAIPAGTVTAILGPNGAGKTTLLGLAQGWLKPQKGAVWLNGQPLQSYGRRALGQWMGLVPQSEHIPFEYSLLEFVLLGRAPHLAPLAMPGDVDCEIAAAALRQVGMYELQERSILSLSGGERQLVLVARALAQEPKLLLLDEPTSHLDLSNKGRLVGLLRRLLTEGVTILFTTHEPEVASALATHLVLMKKGSVLHTGTFQDVFTTQNLSDLYQLPVSVAEIQGKKVALWA